MDDITKSMSVVSNDIRDIVKSFIFGIPGQFGCMECGMSWAFVKMPQKIHSPDLTVVCSDYCIQKQMDKFHLWYIADMKKSERNERRLQCCKIWYYEMTEPSKFLDFILNADLVKFVVDGDTKRDYWAKMEYREWKRNTSQINDNFILRCPYHWLQHPNGYQANYDNIDGDIVTDEDILSDIQRLL